MLNINVLLEKGNILSLSENWTEPNGSGISECSIVEGGRVVGKDGEGRRE